MKSTIKIVLFVIAAMSCLASVIKAGSFGRLIANLCGYSEHPLPKHYAQLSKYLETHLPNNDELAANIEIAQFYSQDSSIKTKRRFKLALKEFIGLKSMLSNDLRVFCSASVVENLEKLDVGTNISTLRLNEQGGFKNMNMEDSNGRLERIIYKQANLHTKKCPEYLEALYSSTFKHFEKYLYHIEDLVFPLIYDHLVLDGHYCASTHLLDKARDCVDANANNVSDFIESGMKPINYEKDAEMVYNYLLKRLTTTELYYIQAPQDKYEHRTKYREIFYRHVLNPCTDFINSYDHLLIPYEFDLVLIGKDRILANEQEEKDIQRALVRFKVCVKLLAEEKSLFKVFEKYLYQRANIWPE